MGTQRAEVRASALSGLRNMSTGLIQIYTGNGKGKTTAALGLALRARGAGKRVAIVFFDKGGDHYSERKILGQLGIDWFAYGLDRIDPKTGRFRFGVLSEDIAEAEKGIERAKGLLSLRRLEAELERDVNCFTSIPTTRARRCRGTRPPSTVYGEVEPRDLGRSDRDLSTRSSGSLGRDDAVVAYDLLILDEINSSVALGMIPEAVVEEIISTKSPDLELVLTGRIEMTRASVSSRAKPPIGDKLREVEGSRPQNEKKAETAYRPKYFDRADLLTDMRLEKHYFYKGIPAREGLDF